MLRPYTIPHPSETITEHLEINGWSQRDLARRSGLTPKTVSELCNGKTSVTAATAVALEKVLGRPAVRHTSKPTHVHFIAIEGNHSFGATNANKSVQGTSKTANACKSADGPRKSV
jgi:transcriptional regulator with XRE-family HTH domain